MIVAAGGGGADQWFLNVGHGGGGAGGILHGVYTISSGSYPVTVGQFDGDIGQNSVFNGHTANGGGYGGWYNNNWNQGHIEGGSGGGGMNTERTGEVYGHPSPRFVGHRCC